MFELIIMSGMGLLFLIVGLLTWKRHFPRFISESYRPGSAKRTNTQPSTKRTGIALIAISIGMFLTGIVDYLALTSYGWIAFGMFFIGGFLLILRTFKTSSIGLF